MHITSEQLPRLREAMKSNRWFEECSEDVQRALLSLSEVRRFDDGDFVAQKDQIVDGFSCVISGRVRLLHDYELKSLIVLDYLPYDWFGEYSLLESFPSGVTALAMGQTLLAHIERSVLLDWLGRNPSYWREFARLLALRIRYGALMLLHATSLPLEERIMQRLRLISTSYGMRKVPSHRIFCSQDELASMVGASRPSVTTALSKLSNQGLVQLSYGAIYLIDQKNVLAKPKTFHEL